MRRPGQSLLVAAAIIGASYLVLHACGGRDATAVLSGTAPLDASALLGLAYAGASFALVVLAPILALASVLRVGLERVWPDDPPSPPVS